MIDIFLLEEIAVTLLLIATLVGIIARRLRMPYTVGLVIVGAVLAIAYRPFDFEMAPQLILGIFVSPLVFEAAFHLPLLGLRRNIVPITTLAVVGVLLTTLLAGAIVHFGAGIATPYAIVFGAIIAATDPVAVIALFRTLSVPKRLQVLLEGESLLNDGTAIVVFNIALAIALEGNFSLPRSVTQFITVAGGGTLIGIALGTLTSLDGPALQGPGVRRFGLAVIDEATQALEPAAYLALLRAERAVLAGDHLQLPPTVLSAAAQAGGLGVSLFERLADTGDGAARVTLAEQHRMNERIMAYPSQTLYGGRLRAHPAVAHWAIDDAPFVLVDTAGRGFEEEVPEGSDSRQNPGEAGLAAAQVNALLGLGVPPAEIAVISPYDAQVQRLRELLAELLEAGLEIDTVDGFQGREKDAVVVNLVRSNPDGEVGFLADVRRMNVAMTRARKKLVVIGDGATVSRHEFYSGLVSYAEREGAWRSAWDP